MARASRDANSIAALLATSNADGQTTLPVYVDSATNRLLVQATISGSIAAGTEYTEGDTDTTFTGAIALAEGPSNTATPLQVDASKHLQVDIAADSVGIGGGTQYTEGDTDASITGNALLFEGAANALVAATGDASNGLDVDVTRSVLPTGASTSAKQDTQITAQQAIQAAVETIDNFISGSRGLVTEDNSAAIAASLSVLDDWDETDRAKVNPIVGQAGVQGGSGAVSSTTQRVVLATDIALPAGTNAIGKLAANSGVDIGDVDVTSVLPGSGATNLGKAEDAGHSTGDTGVYVLGVRNDTPNTALTSTDADYGSISLYRTGAVRTAIPEEDFAALGSNHVKKYYTNAGAVTDGIVWSPAAGKRWYVTDIFIGVSAAATVTLEDDLSGGDSAVFKMEFSANSGWSHRFGTPLFSGEDAADLLVTTSAGNVYITITGYEI
jgi:hypothetical protein